jgi:hypothetical protein
MVLTTTEKNGSIDGLVIREVVVGNNDIGITVRETAAPISELMRGGSISDNKVSLGVLGGVGVAGGELSGSFDPVTKLRLKFQVQHPEPERHRMLRWTKEASTSAVRNVA